MTLAERVAQLEIEMAELKRQLENRPTNTNIEVKISGDLDLQSFQQKLADGLVTIRKTDNLVAKQE